MTDLEAATTDELVGELSRRSNGRAFVVLIGEAQSQSRGFRFSAFAPDSMSSVTAAELTQAVAAELLETEPE